MNYVVVNNRIAKKSKKIVLILSTVALLSAVAASTFLEPVVKYINTIGMLSTMFIFPYCALKKNDFDKITRCIVGAIVAMAIIQTIRSILYPDLQLKGNLYLTLFGNEFCTLSLIISIFIFLCQSEQTLINLKSITLIFCLIGCVCTLLFSCSIYFSSWVVTAFFLYYKGRQKIVIYMVYALMAYGALFAEETSRTDIAILGIFAMAIASCKFNFSKKIISLFCYSLTIVPLIYLVITLLDPSSSVIQIVLEGILNRTSDSNLANDTRTFLFVEMVEDLNVNDAWLWGKGARAGYFSQYFLNLTSGEGDHWYRLTSEVGVLHYLLRGGLIFLIFHYGLIFYAVNKALVYGKNRFVLSIAILASGWIFVSCFSFLHGFNMTYVGFFIILGCCMSKKWLCKTDKEIYEIFSAKLNYEKKNT